jgi:hypothetical protein
MRIGEPKHFRWLKGLVASVIVLNVIDGILTIVWILTGGAIESNPLMNYLIQLHPVLFIITKMTVVSLGILFLWHFRQKALAVIGISIAFICYYAVTVYHFGAIGWLVGG